MDRLASKNIYDFLSEEQLRKLPIVNIAKDTVFISAIDQKNIDLYYILDGVVEVVSQSYNGRSFLIDTVVKGEFIGKFSNMRNKNFYSDIRAATPCKLLKLTDIKNELLNNDQFLLFFYFKTSNRLYEMYKISMMRTLFTYEEILAYYLLEIATEDGVLDIKDKNICLETSVSERQYYYILKKFRNSKIIGHTEKGLSILDRNGLESIAISVIKFMTNRI